jgi:ferritin
MIDMYHEKIEPDWGNLHLIKYNMDTKSMLEAYLEHESEMCKKVSELANMLTVNDYLYESHLLREYIECITHEIIKCKRYIHDFEKSDWNWHHIRWTDNKLHEKYKERECEEFSYKD